VSKKGSTSQDVEVQDRNKAYLEYLDKEMNIMGILSAFSVIAAGLALDRTMGATAMTALAAMWASQSPYLLGGSLMLMIAGLYFYLQRSLLAWYYGQITLSMSEVRDLTPTTRQWLRDSDSWATWIHYRTAFAAVACGFLFYGFALFPGYLPWPAKQARMAVFGVIFVGASWTAIQQYVLTKFGFEDDPWRALADSFRRRKRK
jgi:hypothetical protein